MIQNIKKWGSAMLLASLAIVQIAPTAQAQTLWELENSVQNTTELTYYNPPVENRTNGEVLAEALINTFDANFTATINSDIHSDGIDVDWSGVQTEYIIDAKAKNVVLKKMKDAFSYSANDVNVDFSINSTDEDYPVFFPFKGTLNWSEQGVFDFENFQFAFKSNINTLKIDNTHIKNYIAGILEVYELLENKWIALDFVALNDEFPELKEYIAELQDDLYYELDIQDLEDLVDYLAIGIDVAVEDEYLLIEKSGNVYTLTDLESEIVVTFVLNNNDTISSISVKGYERWEDTEIKSAEYSNLILDVSVEFLYNSPVVEFPAVATEDFDITAFYKMFLEIEQADILAEQKENQFYLDLNVFSGNANEAVTYLTKNGSPTDVVFVQEYLTNAKNLDRNIRKKDINELSIYGLDWWEINYLYDDIKYDVNAYNSNDRYDDKYALETLLEAFDASNLDSGDKNTYHYIDWDIYDQLNISIDTRGDILIILAKIRTAEQLRDARK